MSDIPNTVVPAPETPPSATLTYQVPTHAEPRVALYGVARICWLLPLVVGLGTLALYAVTREDMLTLVGLLTILGGAALLGIGGVCLGVFWFLLRTCAPDVRRAWSRRTIRLGLLLAANVPIAIACAFAAAWMMSRLTVTVINDASVPLTDVTINVPGSSATIPTLEAKSSVTRTLSVSGEGDLTFSAIRDGQTVTGAADSYLETAHGADGGTVRFTDTTASATVR